MTFVPCFDYWYSFFVNCDTLTEVFSVFFLQLLGKCQGITHKRRDTARTYINYYNIISYHMIHRASFVVAKGEFTFYTWRLIHPMYKLIRDCNLNSSTQKDPGVLTLCRSNLKPYCMGRKAAFFSVGI